MKWKLRIPLILFVISITSSIYQTLNSSFTSNSYLLNSFIYILITGAIIFILEKTRINDKEIHISIGIIIIIVSIFLDYYFR